METTDFVNKLQEILKSVQRDNYLVNLNIRQFNKKLAEHLSLEYKGNDRKNPSFYNHLYKTTNTDEIVEIRLSNHFGEESHLLNEDGTPRYADAVSVVIETTENPELHNFSTSYSKYYKEIVYTKDKFDSEVKKKTIIEIVKGLISALKNGKYPTVRQGVVHIYRNEELKATKEDDSLNCITNIIHKFMTTKKTTTKKTAKKSATKAKTTTAKKTRKATEKQLEALKKAREARAEAKKAEKKAAKAKAEAKKTITKAKATAKKVKASAKKSIKKALTSAKKQVRKTVSKATTSTRKRITKSTKAIIDRTAKSLKKKGLAGCSNLDAVNCLFYYMWNNWDENECHKIFGKVMGDHYYSKWNVYDGNFERLWANMSDEYREKLLNRAIEVQSAKKKNFLKTLQNS